MDEAIGKRILALVVPQTGDMKKTFGSAGRLAPGVFLTALHCVRDCLIQDRKLSTGSTVPADAVCDIVALNAIDARTSLDDPPRFTAKLIWPPAGTPFDDTDFAILRVNDDHLLPGDVRPATVRRSTVHGIDAVAYGYPTFLLGGDKSGWKFADHFVKHMAMGTLSTSDDGAGLHQFQVSGDAPPKVEEWGGMSGAVVIEKGPPSCDALHVLGVVARHPPGGQGRSLRILPMESVDALDKALSDDFYAKACLRRRAAPSGGAKVALGAYTRLLDRKVEVDELLGVAAPVAVQARPSLVIALCANVNDCDVLFIDRLGREMEWRFGVTHSSAAAALRSASGPYALRVSSEILVAPKHDARHLLHAFYEGICRAVTNPLKLPAPVRRVDGKRTETSIEEYETFGESLAPYVAAADSALFVFPLRRAGIAGLADIDSAFEDFVDGIVTFAAHVRRRNAPAAFVVSLAVSDRDPPSQSQLWAAHDMVSFESAVKLVFGDVVESPVDRAVTRLRTCTEAHVSEWYTEVNALMRDTDDMRLPADGARDIVKLANEVAQREGRTLDEWPMAIVRQAIDNYRPQTPP